MKTANPLYGQQLIQAGFERATDERFVRNVDISSTIDDTYENFSRHIEQILFSMQGWNPSPGRVRFERSSAECKAPI